MKKAPEELQKFADSVEKRAFALISGELKMRGSALVVREGSDDSRENGEGGDILIARNTWEAPFISIEAKSSPTYPRSFSITDYEKRVSEATYCYVEGTLGVWCVSMESAKGFLNGPTGTGNDKYWVTQPEVYRRRIAFSTMIDNIQLLGGEIPTSFHRSSLSVFTNDKKL